MSTTSQTQGNLATLDMVLQPVNNRIDTVNGEFIDGGVPGKMDRLDLTKESIRQVINEKGVKVTPDEPFASYLEKIAQLPALPEKDDWRPNPTWWDIETILKEDTRDYAYKSILLYMDTYPSTDLREGSAYATSDGHFYANEDFVSTSVIEHHWDPTKDKQCVEKGVNTYKIRYIIVYSKTPIRQFPSGWGNIGMLGGIMQQNTTNTMDTPFSIQYQLQFIKILEGTEKLSSYFADGCPNLRSVTLPQSLKTLLGTINACLNLRSITLPDNLKVLPKYVFERCYNLSAVKLPVNLEILPDHAFQECSGLKSIDLPETLTTIGTQAFIGCTALNNVVLPAASINLGEGVFSGCTGLQNITLPEELKEIPARMFAGCSSLKNITFPSGLESIGARAFERVVFTELTLPASLKKITSPAFIDCSALTTLNIQCTSVDGQISFSSSPLAYVSVPADMDCSTDISNSDLSVDNLLYIFHALKDNSGLTAKTFNIGHVNRSKLTDEQKAIATDKNWILA